jgi:hypothetical protein
MEHNLTSLGIHPIERLSFQLPPSHDPSESPASYLMIHPCHMLSPSCSRPAVIEISRPVGMESGVRLVQLRRAHDAFSAGCRARQASQAISRLLCGVPFLGGPQNACVRDKGRLYGLHQMRSVWVHISDGPSPFSDRNENFFRRNLGRNIRRRVESDIVLINRTYYRVRMQRERQSPVERHGQRDKKK